ncbi:hypothetical protein BHM03_00049028 [Ensete ventricosum]|nr:hypothetical protein BHM03_00049028 [Ensete ventricosum]
MLVSLHVIALCRILSSFSRRLTVHISFIWTWRVTTGLSFNFIMCCIMKKYSSDFLVFSLDLQAFARLSAVYGGTYMLNKPECKVSSNSWWYIHRDNRGIVARYHFCKGLLISISIEFEQVLTPFISRQTVDLSVDLSAASAAEE